MSSDEKDDPLGDLLGDELGEWDAMFDSLHESGDEGGLAGLTPAREASTAVPDADLVLSESAAAPEIQALLESDSQNEFDLDRSMGAPFEGAPDAGAAVDVLVPGAGDSPFATDEEEEDFGEILGSQPEALGGLLGSGPIGVPKGSQAKRRPPSASEIRASQEAIVRARPKGPEDVALDDFGAETTGTMTPETITRMSKSAEAFFDDDVDQESAGEISLALDDDFYDGIQIGDGDEAPPDVDAALFALSDPAEAAEAAEAPKKRTLAHVVRRAPSEFSSDVQELEIIAEMASADSAVPTPMEEEDPFSAIPLPILEDTSSEAYAIKPEVGGVGRKAIGVAVDDALAGLLSEESKPLPSVRPASEIPEFTGAIDLEGVVEAAVEDAVAMSTGTLLTGPRLEEPDVEPDLPPEKFARAAPGPDLGAIDLPVDVGLATEDRTDEYAQLLVLYERELALLDEVGPSIRLRIEAGRIAETLGDLEQARVHLDEALKFDPNLVPANRALRRIERVLGNWEEVIHLLERELTKASPAENDALALCRVGLLMAVGELDLARVAVGELLDASPTDARALLANLDLAFMDGREDEVVSTLDSLAEVLAEPALTAAAVNLGASLAERGGHSAKAMMLYGRANELQPGLGSAMGLRSSALLEKSPEVAAHALEQARQRSHSTLRAGLDWQSGEMHLRRSENAEAREVLSEALTAHPEDVLLRQQLVRACAGDRELSAGALQGLASGVTSASWASQLLGRAGRLSLGAEAKHIFLRAAEHEPQSRFAAEELRQSRIAAQEWSEVYESDCEVATATPVSVYRRAHSALRSGLTAEALSATIAYRSAPTEGSLALEVATLDLAYGVNDLGQLSQYQVPSAAGSAADIERAERTRSRALTRQALANIADGTGLHRAATSWGELASAGSDQDAGEIAWQLATMSKDAELLDAHRASAETQASSPGRATQITIETAGLHLAAAPEKGAEILHELQASRPSRRAGLLQWSFALGAGDLAGAAACFEAEADRLESEDTASADRYLYRAAFLRVQHDIESSLAATSLDRISARRPEFGAAADLRASVVGGQGVINTSSATGAAPVVEHDDLSSELHRAEALARSGEHAAAAELFVILREQHPEDALVIYGFERACWQAGASGRLAEYELAALRVAEDRGDGVAKARAAEELARVDGELRGDYGSALMFWESASLADPGRADLLRTLERELGNQGGEYLDGESMWKALGRIIGSLEEGRERCFYLLERARVGSLLGRPEAEVVADYAQAFADNLQCREALFYLEARASQQGPSDELADLESKVSDYFASDPRARAAFLVRSGETMRSLEQEALALSRFKTATETMPGYAPALFAWRETALDHEMWGELAEACLLEATSVDSDRGRADLYHLAGVTLMDKAEEPESAVDALRKVLAVNPSHRDAFVRLRSLFVEGERPDDLAQLLSMRLEVETDEGVLCEVHRALADVLREALGNGKESLIHLRSVLEIRPNDKSAITAVSEIAWELGLWAEAAEALMVLARIEQDKTALIEVFSKLGTIYSEHLVEPKWALKSFRKVISLDSSNKLALEKFAVLAAENGDHQLALGACEQLIKQDPPVAEKIVYLHRMAKSFVDGFGDTDKAERALRVALDLDMASESAFDALISFYLAQNSMRSARVHVDRVANAMRMRIRKDICDLTAYRVLARAMDTRCKAGVPESRIIATAAAGIALLLGDKSPAMKTLAGSAKSLARSRGLATGEHDELLFPSAAQGGVQALLAMLGDRLAKHVGTDVRSHGVGRSDRLRKGDPVGEIINPLAADMGLEEVEIYLSSQKPLVLAAEPTKPPSLIFGTNLVSAERPEELRFLAGRSIKLVSAQLSVPLQLGVEKFGILLVGVLRQFQADFVPLGVDEGAAAAEQQRLRRLIPSGMLQELGPFAMGLATSDFDHRVIWQALLEAGNRAGLLCAGDARAAISALMREKNASDPRKALQEPEIADLVRFACSEEHASLFAALP